MEGIQLNIPMYHFNDRWTEAFTMLSFYFKVCTIKRSDEAMKPHIDKWKQFIVYSMDSLWSLWEDVAQYVIIWVSEVLRLGRQVLGLTFIYLVVNRWNRWTSGWGRKWPGSCWVTYWGRNWMVSWWIFLSSIWKGCCVNGTANALSTVLECNMASLNESSYAKCLIYKLTQR